MHVRRPSVFMLSNTAPMRFVAFCNLRSAERALAFATCHSFSTLMSWKFSACFFVMRLHIVILVVYEHVVDTGDDDAFFDVERMAGMSPAHRVQPVGLGGCCVLFGEMSALL